MADQAYQIGKAFTEHYYGTFDNNRPGLQGLYSAEAMLTFQGDKIQGPAAIQEKLNALPFKKCKHNVTVVDAQPSLSNGIVIFVCGNLQVDDDNPLNFSQVFHLTNINGNFVVTNDMFRLNSWN